MLVISRQQAKILNTPHGSQIRALIDRTTAPITQCSLAEEVLPPGATVTPHHHEIMEEIYFITSGTGIMSIDGDARTVNTGDSIYIPRGAVHSLYNNSTQPMHILLVCGPAYLPEDHR
jgi:mannose-6-phosphate isomerase-like protein (cupin superfamily)